MGDIIDITKLLQKAAEAAKGLNAAEKTKPVLSAEEAIRHGIETARSEAWKSKFGTSQVPAPVHVNELNDLYRRLNIQLLDHEKSVPPPPEPVAVPPPEPPPVKVQIIPHPSSEEAVIAPSAIPNRQALIDQEDMAMRKHALAESAYMSGSISHEDYIKEYNKIFTPPGPADATAVTPPPTPDE